MEALETLQSSPHQVDMSPSGQLCSFKTCRIFFIWLSDSNSFPVSLSCLCVCSESDVPHVLLDCESLHIGRGRGSPDGLAHASHDGTGGHP